MDVLTEFIPNILKPTPHEVGFLPGFFFFFLILHNLLGIFTLEIWKVHRTFISPNSITNFVYKELSEIPNLIGQCKDIASGC